MRNLMGYLKPALLPLVFIWYIGCIGLTPHTHIVDGVKVVHSHPVSAEDHEHSAEETIGIELICNFCRDLAVDGIVLPSAAEILLNALHYELASPSVLISSVEVLSLRAPPCFS
jgi:hypothetical protein